MIPQCTTEIIYTKIKVEKLPISGKNRFLNHLNLKAVTDKILWNRYCDMKYDGIPGKILTTLNKIDWNIIQQTTAFVFCYLFKKEPSRFLIEKVVKMR